MARASFVLCLVGALALVNPATGSWNWKKAPLKGNIPRRNIGFPTFKDSKITPSHPVFSSAKINFGKTSLRGSSVTSSSNNHSNMGRGGKSGSSNSSVLRSAWNGLKVASSVMIGVASSGLVPLPELVLSGNSGNSGNNNEIYATEQILRDITCPGQEIAKSTIVSEMTYIPFNASGVMLENRNITFNTSQRGNDLFVVVGTDTANDTTKTSKFTRTYVLYFEGSKKFASYSCHEIDGTTKEVFTESLGKANNYESVTLQRGQLVPKNDFAEVTQQQQTNINENAVPQWSSINEGNWKVVEEAVRKLAHSKDKILYVVTGTWGQFQRKLNSHVNSQRNRELSIPALFWKLVYDPQNKTGVIIFVSNNPFHSFQKLNITPCSKESVCSHLSSWLKHNSNSQILKRGEILCCKINEVNPALKLHDIISTYKNADLLK